MKKFWTQIIGAHRGGRAFTELALAERDRLSFPLFVQIIDPEPERVRSLAKKWEEKGIEAIGVKEKAQSVLSPNLYPHIRLLAIDDLSALLAIVNSGNQKVLEFGFLISSGFPEMGSRVLGFGGSILEGDSKAKEETLTLVKILTALTPERTSSQVMSALPVNEIQMENVRSLLHQELVRDFQKALTFELQDSRLFGVEAFNPCPPFIYPLKLVPFEREVSPREMKTKAKEIAKQFPGDTLGVIFYQDSPPWLYISFLTKRERWLIRQAVEFPVPHERLDIWEEGRRPRIVATD